MNTLRSNLEHGIPYYGMDSVAPRGALKARTAAAKSQAVLAHKALQTAFRAGDKRVVTLDGDKEGEKDMYITFADGDGHPCYFAWDSGNPATDIGLRMVNPDYDGEVNPTTILHADTHAARDFQDREAPIEVVRAMDSLGGLNQFITGNIALPYLSQIAEIYGLDVDEYIEHFLPRTRRIRTLTRSILYHLGSRPGQRPVGTDGRLLLVKEHNDKSAFTIDVEQSSPGLQYKVGGSWQNADTLVACFRGAADDYLPERTPPTLHRAVYDKAHKQTTPAELVEAGIARIAIPTFISPSDNGARVVQAGSLETHPTSTSIRDEVPT